MTDADRLCEAGTEKMERGEAAAALAEYDAAIQLDGRHLLAHVNRGIVRAALGRPAEAEADFTRAIAIDPMSELAHFQRGLFLSHTGQLSRAIEDFDRALEKNPASSAAFFNRGVARLKHGEPEPALQDFARAILHSTEEDPNRADAHHLRGLILRDQGKRSEALAEFDSALRLMPRDAEKLYSRARVHLALQSWEEAVQDLTACLSAENLDDRTRADALMDRSSVWIRMRKLPEAIADLDAALELAPDHPTALFNRGEAHFKAGRRELAARDFRRLLELQPEDAEARDYLNRTGS